MADPINIFCCYAHEDEAAWNELAKHLGIMQKQGLINLLHYRNISAGIDWKLEINTYLNEAHIILLLISVDFLNSDYYNGYEVKRAVERYEKGEARIIPVILRSVDWKETTFGRLLALPEGDKPVEGEGWLNRDAAYSNIAHGIRKVIDELRLESLINSYVPPSTPDKKLVEELQEEQSVTSLVTTPSLVILLGGTSALASLELMRHMLALNRPDQQRVALVYIDTDNPPSALVEFRNQYSGLFQEFPLRFTVPMGIANVELVNQGDGGREQHTFIGNKIPDYFENPSGSIRNNGHIAACFHYQQIYETLYQAISAIAGEAIDREVQAHIVSFLGGGTGSGILPDIAIILRDILTNLSYRHRLNLFCILPEPVYGIDYQTLNWYKSNAVACLLELIAYSSAANTEPNGRYKKFMRAMVNHLNSHFIAHEIYLVGQSGMNDYNYTARMVGLDLYQRITDSSGVGFLEHSEQVRGLKLRATDDRGLPTNFGTSCPFEALFPLEETATSFAQMSAANLLPKLRKHLFRSLLQPSEVRRFENALEAEAKILKEKCLASHAWQGWLDYPHPNSRHIFDLRSLRTSDGQNYAIRRLYCWAISGDSTIEDMAVLNYGNFVNKCIDYLSNNNSISHSSFLRRGKQVDGQSIEKLADRVIQFFYDYHFKQFRNMNLFDLLDKATPLNLKGISGLPAIATNLNPKGSAHRRQISNYLMEHMQHIRGLSSRLTAFEAELWTTGSLNIDTSIYLGMHWHDEDQKAILDEALDMLGSISRKGQRAEIEQSLDLHKLQMTYSQHGLSLSIIRDFYLERNSAMESYLYFQEQWKQSNGTGLLPVHTSGEAERLVWSKKGNGESLPYQVIRRPFYSGS